MLMRFVLLLVIAAFTGPLAGQEKFTAETMWSLARLGDPSLSPRGDYAVVPVTSYDVDENRGYTDLWLLPTREGSARQLTSDAANDTSPVFSPDGQWVAFISKRGEDKEPQIYVIAVNGGEARRVTDVPTGANAPKWFPDSRRIAFATPIWTDLVRWEDQKQRMDARASTKMSGKVWDRAPIAYWDRYLDDREPHLYSIAVEGGEPTAITRMSGHHLSKNEYDSHSYDISPDGTEVAFVANTDDSGIEPNLDVIVLASCGCKPARNVTDENAADDERPAYSPDGKYLAFTQARVPGFYADRARLMLLDRSTLRARALTEDWDRTVGNLVWATDSRSLVSSIDDAATNRLYRFDVRGGEPQAITSSPSFTSPDTAGDTLIAMRQSFSEPPTLVRVDPRTGASTKLSTLNDPVLASVKLGKVESVTYRGANDSPIQMWVVYPPDFDPAKKYPVYMLLHGGPHNAITDAVSYRWNAHVFASWGYIVTWHNFHGSSGFGEAFTDSINPDRITLPYADTIKAAEWLAAQPFVDGERLAAGGGSYGGYLAATLLGRPHPFRTLIAHAAVYNGFTQYAADYGAEKERFFSFWERPEEFAKYSPHTNAGNFTTPTLVIHGQQDLRVPVNHGIELFNTLQMRGVPSKLLYFPDENHWILKPQNSLFWYQTTRDWLASYVEPGGRQR